MKEADVTNRVRHARDCLGITQQELARRVGVTRQTIGLIERGKYNPTVRLALMLGAELGEGIERLFWLADDSAGKR